MDATSDSAKKARQKEANRRSYLKNRDTVLERSRIWHALHPRDKEKARISSAEWRKANPEKAKAFCNKYNKENKEKRLAYGRAYRKRNKQHLLKRYKAYYYKHREQRLKDVKAYARNNPEKMAAIGHRKRTRKRKSPGYGYTNEQHISWRWEMFGNKCWICRKDANATDHVKPVSKGGSHWPCNLRPICKECNSSKSARWYGVHNLGKFIK